MAKVAKFCLALLLAFALLCFSVYGQSPESSPSPAPELGADVPSPQAPAPSVVPQANPPSNWSPPGPSPVDPAPASSPTPSQSKSPAPTPSPSNADVLDHVEAATGEDEAKDSSGGTSSGKKAGIIVGVVVAAGVVVLAGFVYKKRRDNIRRSQYGYAARREIL
ncbi:vegetative cell wall protein gp1-like [Juglans regia]|uniref:Vegetative cell wall protein gp1-like n=1 Tax=Juglans regia TaxID=51240 RepID=A0A2I4HKA9_JUGRE|nr:vegetative cell wall protein gp1-like [Juglans regia]XP_035545827.1 vegetative cell wall protein gp1-like [Juglans regia]